MKQIIEENQIDISVQSADIDTADVDSAVFYDATDFEQIAGIAKVTADLTAGKVVSVQLLQATAADGTGKKVLGSAVTEAAASGALQPTARVEVSADALDHENGFVFVGVRIGTDEGSAIDGAGVVVRGRPKFQAVGSRS